MTNQIIIRQAKAGDMARVHKMLWAYRDLLLERTGHISDIVEAYYAADAYEQLLSDLPNKHARPDGCILVAERKSNVIGCAMTHRIDATTCEIKRVFVDDAARGQGAAVKLFVAAMQQAKTDGYTRMVLDTVRQLPEAVALYEKLGFEPADPFYELNPKYADMILFFDITL